MKLKQIHNAGEALLLWQAGLLVNRLYDTWNPYADWADECTYSKLLRLVDEALENDMGGYVIVEDDEDG